MYLLKAGIEKAGKLDRVAVAKALHGLSVSAAKYPGVIMDVNVDANGDLDRESFIVEVKNGKQSQGDPAAAGQEISRPATQSDQGRDDRLPATAFLRRRRGAIYGLAALASRCCGRPRARSTSRRASSSCCRPS